MKPLLERIRSGETLVGDGAIGTLLLERGLRPGQCPESLTLTRPEVLEEIASLYLDAGSDIITTNTFGASPLKLASYHLQDETERINFEAVAAVRKVVGNRACVAGSCGPSGRLLKPHGDTDLEDVDASYRRQMRALIGAGVDCICVETMLDLAETKSAIRAARDVSPGIPVLATMTFDATPRGFYTIMGVSIEAAAAGLAEAGADVIGSNCGNGAENMVKVARAFRGCTSLPILIQSNAGLPETRDGRLIYKETPAFMAERAVEMMDIGVSVIGGCCGTTPEHIRAIRKVVDARAKG